MVYRGKPSAGCENCRKAKKRCTLEQPACARCVKLNKPCSGYRDTTGLQIQDETLSVTRKAEKKQTQHSLAPTPVPSHLKSRTATPAPGPTWTVASGQKATSAGSRQRLSPDDAGPSGYSDRSATPLSIPTPRTDHSDSSSSSEGTVDVFSEFDAFSQTFESSTACVWPAGYSYELEWTSLPRMIQPKPDEVAISYFLNCFTASGHWDYILKYANAPRLDPCLTMAIKACGMAALENVRQIPRGKDWSRSLYMNAIGLLNDALRDPKRSRTDESLIAVSMLSFFENLVCDSKQSIQSWKAHIAGATQLLKMRGRSQFKTNVGRNLFREVRAQIMIHCIWDDIEPPTFLVDWNPDLQSQDLDPELARPADDISDICYDFARLENKLKFQKISDEEALAEISDVDRRMVQWSIDTLANESRWRYYDLQVDDSPHVWNGMVHAYVGFPSPGVWNMYRAVRIMVTRTQELLAMRFNPSKTARQAQHSYFRAIRRQLTDEICAAVPVALGHSQPAFSSPCVLISSYNSIWPLFFAGTCVLERIGNSTGNPSSASNVTSSAAMAQLAWILGRFDYISQVIGLRWADGVAATLRGDFKIHDKEMLPQSVTGNNQQDSAVTPELQRMLDDDASKPDWIRDIEESGRGPRILIEGDRRLPGGLGGLWEEDRGTKWLGKHAEDSEIHNG